MVNNLGEKLKKLRLEKHLSFREIYEELQAKGLKIGKITLWRIEKGIASPRGRTIRKLEEYFNTKFKNDENAK